VHILTIFQEIFFRFAYNVKYPELGKSPKVFLIANAIFNIPTVQYRVRLSFRFEAKRYETEAKNFSLWSEKKGVLRIISLIAKPQISHAKWNDEMRKNWNETIWSEKMPPPQYQ
jgi:hypothetical protein